MVYNLYLQLGVDGLRGLENYNPDTKVGFVRFETDHSIEDVADCIRNGDKHTAEYVHSHNITLI